MIGKMAEEKELDEKTGSGDSEEDQDDEEVEANGKDDFDEDDPEFDDPEGFVDEVTDEGKFQVSTLLASKGFQFTTFPIFSYIPRFWNF